MHNLVPTLAPNDILADLPQVSPLGLLSFRLLDLTDPRFEGIYPLIPLSISSLILASPCGLLCNRKQAAIVCRNRPKLILATKDMICFIAAAGL